MPAIIRQPASSFGTKGDRLERDQEGVILIVRQENFVWKLCFPRFSFGAMITSLGQSSENNFCLEIHFELCWKFEENILFPTALLQLFGEPCVRESSPFKSSGRHCALPVAYLSNVTNHLSRYLKKTPASAFTPISHPHISFSCPLRLPFHFLFTADTAKWKWYVVCLFVITAVRVMYLP